MKILYYDCFSGISGDMNLGAMIDIGVDKNYLLEQLDKLNMNNEYYIDISKDNKNGIYGTRVNVLLKNNHDDDHHHNDSHDHHHRHHRNFKDIENIIKSAQLNENVKNISLNIFKKVAEAEGKVHNKSMEEVHFHEVGAVDSIVDIVGAAICFDYLKVDKIMASTVEVGSGFVECAHGTLPVPAPATAEILKGVPLISNVDFEATTPTGAAILSYSVKEFTNRKKFNIERVGYGIGTKDGKQIPNVLRVFIANGKLCQDENDYITGEVSVVDCNIDDMNPEMYEYVMQRLFDEGALDVYFTPIIMKKERPGVKINVLCNDENLNKIKEVIFKHTSTLGLREYKVNRYMLKREFEKVKTIYGDITVKKAYYKGNVLKYKPEYEECKKVAISNDISINDVYKEVVNKVEKN